MKFKHGFSLTELLIVIAIIMILASMIAINMDSYKQTAKQEAEKLAGYIHDLMRKADRSHKGFEIYWETTPERIRWQWSSNKISWANGTDGILIYKKNLTATDKPVISPGFTIEYKFSGYADNKLKYGTDGQFNKNGHFKITRDDDKTDICYIYFRLGRIRCSEDDREAKDVM